MSENPTPHFFCLWRDAPAFQTRSSLFELRRSGRPPLARPFFDHPEQTDWKSFTVTMNGNKLLSLIENYMGITRPVCPVIPYNRDKKILLTAVSPSFR
ncbi:MAG: hypothetical protein EOM52_11365 [Clostridia bacterium]|nr:hypothetical protein [Clostridia bacterium]